MASISSPSVSNPLTSPKVSPPGVVKSPRTLCLFFEVPVTEARTWMQQFVQGYNQAHRHSGIQFVTPEQRHQGHDGAILANRQTVYEQAKARHPERWSGPIRNWQPVTEVWLNPSAEVQSAPVKCSQ